MQPDTTTSLKQHCVPFVGLPIHFPNGEIVSALHSNCPVTHRSERRKRPVECYEWALRSVTEQPLTATAQAPAKLETPWTSQAPFEPRRAAYSDLASIYGCRMGETGDILDAPSSWLVTRCHQVSRTPGMGKAISRRSCFGSLLSRVSSHPK